MRHHVGEHIPPQTSRETIAERNNEYFTPPIQILLAALLFSWFGSVPPQFPKCNRFRLPPGAIQRRTQCPAAGWPPSSRPTSTIRGTPETHTGKDLAASSGPKPATPMTVATRSPNMMLWATMTIMRITRTRTGRHNFAPPPPGTL